MEAFRFAVTNEGYVSGIIDCRESESGEHFDQQKSKYGGVTGSEIKNSWYENSKNKVKEYTICFAVKILLLKVGWKNNILRFYEKCD